MITIESFSNPRFKRLKGLSKSRNRVDDGLFLMEGRVELALALRIGHKPVQVVFSEAYVGLNELQRMLPANSPTEMVHLTKAMFDDLAYQNVPGNFIAVFEVFKALLPNQLQDPLVAVFDQVEKPGNLGAALRTCDALGIKNVFVTNSDLDLFNPNVLRNSRGAVFSVNCHFLNQDQVFMYLKEQGYMLAAAALSKSSVPYNKVEYRSKTAVVMGSESKGLSIDFIKHCDQQVIIPMLGEVDSLNVSVSFAIIASFVTNQLNDQNFN